MDCFSAKMYAKSAYYVYHVYHSILSTQLAVKTTVCTKCEYICVCLCVKGRQTHYFCYEISEYKAYLARW